MKTKKKEIERGNHHHCHKITYINEHESSETSRNIAISKYNNQGVVSQNLYPNKRRR